MQPEIEVKFLDVDHSMMRAMLTDKGAKLEEPMRVMRRTLFDYPDKRLEASRERLRVR